MVRKELSERITIRLPKKMVNDIDDLVQVGEYTNRSDVVREAVKMFLNTKIEDVVKRLNTRKEFHKYVSEAMESEKEENEILRQ
jgi:Arc/MetJ-type ribon-helix-helix transcriptional regulator